MPSMVLAAAVGFGALLVSAVLWALCLRLGLRWAGITGVASGGVIAITAIVFSVEMAVGVFRYLTLGFSGILPLAVTALLLFVAVAIVPCILIRIVSRASLPRSIQAWLPTLLATSTVFAFPLLVIGPFLYEAFVVPTNGMAPAILGKHQEGICPQCGQKNFGSAVNPRLAESDEPRPMICDNFHVTEGTVDDKTVLPGDRILAAKFLAPQRWDIIVFQVPSNPKVLYIQRLVGLPGETIEIRDGAVWADGKKLTMPDELAGLEYLDEDIDSPSPDLWGSHSKPATLGDDEYFVLGDFSRQSYDSRMWHEGAPGRQPYAVPRSHIKGVVIHTYWPLERQRTHR